MEIYDRVTKAVAVAPKRINLKGAEKELRETLEILEGKRAELKEVLFISSLIISHSFRYRIYISINSNTDDNTFTKIDLLRNVVNTECLANYWSSLS